MSQRVDTRMREPEQPVGVYEQSMATFVRMREQTATGAVVVRSKDLDWEQSRQGRLKFFSHVGVWERLAAPGWSVFEHDIRRHSGKHVHQGGLCIFVLEGRGYTVVDGVRYDWKKGDLIVLPIKQGGIEHQHFNAVEGQPCHWIAFVFRPLTDLLANQLVQREVSPEWKAT